MVRRAKTKVQPTYPELAHKMNISGTVKIEVAVAPNGTVKEARVVGGHPVLAGPRWMPPRSGALNRRRRRARESSISSSSRGKRAAAEETGMTIGKKLYMNFGFILAMVLVLFLVNWLAVQREHEAKDAAATSLKLADATNAVRFQMMQNRLYLSNYLLSGDTREVDRMNEGLRTLNEKLEEGKTLANSDQVKSALAKVQQLEQAWGKEFAQPLIEKRKDVDSGNATVAELQIYYLQKDASSWVKNSTDALDVADGENHKLVEAAPQIRRNSAANWTIRDFFAHHPGRARLGVVIAYRTANSITEPLTNLMNVARGRSATPAIWSTTSTSNRDDEIGELARTFAQDGHVPQGDGGGIGSHRRRRPDGGGEAAFVARHPGQRLRQDGRRPGRPGAQRTRCFFAGGQRFQPGGRSLGRLGQDRLAGVLRHR